MKYFTILSIAFFVYLLTCSLSVKISSTSERNACNCGGCCKRSTQYWVRTSVDSKCGCTPTLVKSNPEYLTRKACEETECALPNETPVTESPYSWKKSCYKTTSIEVGGYGGGPFDVFSPIAANMRNLHVKRIDFHWGAQGAFIGFLKFTYNDGSSIERAGEHDALTMVGGWDVPAGDYINRIKVWASNTTPQYVAGLQVFTAGGANSQLMGNPASDATVSDVTLDQELIGFGGRSGWWFDRLVFYSMHCDNTCFATVGPMGQSNGVAFGSFDGVQNNFLNIMGSQGSFSISKAFWSSGLIPLSRYQLQANDGSLGGFGNAITGDGSFTFASGEDIVGAKVLGDTTVNAIKLVSSSNQTPWAGLQSGKQLWAFNLPSGRRVVGFYGILGKSALESITFVTAGTCPSVVDHVLTESALVPKNSCYKTISIESGGMGGWPFDQLAPIQARMRNLHVSKVDYNWGAANRYIYFVQFTYTDGTVVNQSGNDVSSNLKSGSFNVPSGDFINRIEVWTSDTYPNQYVVAFKLYTINGLVSDVMGVIGQKDFYHNVLLDQELIGFAGRSGSWFDKLIFYSMHCDKYCFASVGPVGSSSATAFGSMNDSVDHYLNTVGVSDTCSVTDVFWNSNLTSSQRFQFKFNDSSLVGNGSAASGDYDFALNSGENLSGFKIRGDATVKGWKMQTNQSRSTDLNGTETGENNWIFSAPAGRSIIGVYGNAGSNGIESLSFVTTGICPPK